MLHVYAYYKDNHRADPVRSYFEFKPSTSIIVFNADISPGWSILLSVCLSLVSCWTHRKEIGGPALAAAVPVLVPGGVPF